jgi:hypothetical protein
MPLGKPQPPLSGYADDSLKGTTLTQRLIALTPGPEMVLQWSQILSNDESRLDRATFLFFTLSAGDTSVGTLQWFETLREGTINARNVGADFLSSRLLQAERDLFLEVIRQEQLAFESGLITEEELRSLPDIGPKGINPNENILEKLERLTRLDPEFSREEMRARTVLELALKKSVIAHLVELKLNFLEREAIKRQERGPFEGTPEAALALRALLEKATAELLAGTRVLRPPKRTTIPDVVVNPDGPGPGAIVVPMWLQDP